jgi:hypothetical protein
MITTVEQLLAAHPDTCNEARSWLAENGITELSDAWNRCPSGSWLLWLCDTLDLLSNRERRIIACRLVRETPIAGGRKVWDLLTDERSRHAVAVAEMYADGSATDDELATAYADATGAARAAASYAARVYASIDAANALAAAYAARAAASTAAAASNALAAADVARAAAMAAEATAYEDTADLIRAIAGNPFWSA